MATGVGCLWNIVICNDGYRVGCLWNIVILINPKIDV